jgi:ABC-type transport system involved in multi-copper enzyme maturation permease subunit
MGSLLLLVLVMVVLGAAGYWSLRQDFGDPGIPAIIGLIMIIVFVGWLLSFLIFGSHTVAPPPGQEG